MRQKFVENQLVDIEKEQSCSRIFRRYIRKCNIMSMSMESDISDSQPPGGQTVDFGAALPSADADGQQRVPDPNSVRLQHL